MYKLYNTLQQLKYRTSTSTWLLREIDKTTGLWYFVIVISTFITAQIIYPKFLEKLPIDFGRIPEVLKTLVPFLPGNYDIVFVLSIAALAMVLFMLYFRYIGLRSMGLVTFKFLAEQGAIKINKESFDKTLEEIRQYLNDGDWTLAGIWVTRIMDQYND